MASQNYESRDGTPISLIITHTNEGPHPVGLHPDHTAEDLAAWMETNGVSYHVVVDDDSVVRVLPDDVASWSALAANHRSLNICFTGRAAWQRSDWLSHDSMLRLGAGVVQDWCVRYAIPLVKLSPAEVGADQWGICGHVDWTIGKHNGTHTDPGNNFPYDVFLGYVFGDDLTPEQDRMLREIYTKETLKLPSRSAYAGPNPGVDDQFGTVLNADGRAHETKVELEQLRVDFDQFKATTSTKLDQILESVVKAA